jgi:hypothetical protein
MKSTSVDAVKHGIELPAGTAARPLQRFKASTFQRISAFAV